MLYLVLAAVVPVLAQVPCHGQGRRVVRPSGDQLVDEGGGAIDLSAGVLTLRDLVVDVGRVKRDHGLLQGPVIIVWGTHRAGVLC